MRRQSVFDKQRFQQRHSSTTAKSQLVGPQKGGFQPICSANSNQQWAFQPRYLKNFEKRIEKRRKSKLEEAESKLRDQKRAKKLSRELQEAPTKLRSHDLSTMSMDYELPRGSDGLWPGFARASPGRRWGVDRSNICHRRGPLSFLAS